MLRKWILALAPLAVSPAVAQPAAPATDSACHVRVDAAPASWIVRGYDPFAAAAAEATFSVTMANNGTGECRFAPMFELDQPPFGLSSGAGKELDYVLLDLTNSIDVTPRPGRSARGSASLRPMVLAAGQSATIMYKLAVLTDDVSNSGTLTENLTLEARDDDLRVLGGTRIVVGLEVLPSARIGLAGAYTISNGHAVVNLGELHEGPAPVPLQLRVSSTGRYDLQITSLNAGRLRLGDTAWQVPYAVTVGGETVDLSGTDTVSGPSEKGLTRSALPIHFVIGDVSDRRAGVYSDLISISVSAR